jgi:hypothetical protein
MGYFVDTIDTISNKWPVSKTEPVKSNMPEQIITEYKRKPKRKTFHQECG